MENEEIDVKLEYNEKGNFDVFVDGNNLMELELTCSACPEQYDLYSLLDKQIKGYFRVRWSTFTCEFPDVGGELVYESDIDEDGWSGSFNSHEQRIEELTKAIKEIIKKLREPEEKYPMFIDL